MTSATTELTDNQERYVEAIFLLQAERNIARVKEIAAALSVKAPTVTNVVKDLADRGFVNHEPYGLITLTEQGERVGRELVLRRDALYEFFHRILGVPQETAESVSSNVEHAIPSSVLCRLVQFNEHYESRVTEKYEWKPDCPNLCDTRYQALCIQPGPGVKIEPDDE